jgi:hydrogenase nickel incorporation protein HypA/HybF
MHEYSIVQALLDQVAERARAHGATAVRRVSVKIGALSGVEPELLATAYDAFRARSICESAPLIIEQVPARWRCPRCSRDVSMGGPLRCAACGAPARLVAGDEILLERIELEVP